MTIEVGLEDEKTVLKTVSLHWEASKLKKFLAQELDIVGRKFVMFLFKRQVQFGPEEMMYPQRTLLRYRVEEGDRIMVQLRDRPPSLDQ